MFGNGRMPTMENGGPIVFLPPAFYEQRHEDWQFVHRTVPTVLGIHVLCGVLMVVLADPRTSWFGLGTAAAAAARWILVAFFVGTVVVLATVPFHLHLAILRVHLMSEGRFDGSPSQTTFIRVLSGTVAAISGLALGLFCWVMLTRMAHAALAIVLNHHWWRFVGYLALASAGTMAFMYWSPALWARMGIADHLALASELAKVGPRLPVEPTAHLVTHVDM
jgi:hypothetical protein